MGTDSPAQKIFFQIALVFIIAFLIALTVNAIYPGWPIIRIVSRSAMLLALVITIRHVRLCGWNWKTVGMSSTDRVFPEWSLGFFIGACSFLALIGLKLASGAAIVSVQDTAPLLKKGLQALMQASLIGFSEELFFRGYITGELSRGLSKWRGIIIASLFFSAVHFLRTTLPSPSEIAAEAFGLFLIGITLAIARLETGRIYFSAGLHAAWVFLMKWDSSFVIHAERDPDWFWAGDRIVMSVPAWIMLAVFIAVLPAVLRRRFATALPQGPGKS